MSSSFKAYINVDEYDCDNNQPDEVDGFNARAEMTLLPGETIITTAEHVLKFTALSEQRQGISGALFVTNFKISFVTADRSSFKSVDRSVRNKILGECDICLSNVEAVFHIHESNNRKKKLIPAGSINTKIQSIQVLCKDFRVHTFSFKFTPRGQERTIINALLHHSFPPRLELLFAFEYKEPVKNGNVGNDTPLFIKSVDWENELKRLNCDSKWRISHANENYLMSRSLPDKFVVPKGLLDEHISKAATHFRDYRLPVWSWSLPDGCAIVRSAGIHPSIQESKEMDSMLDIFKDTHPLHKTPHIAELEKMLPGLKDIQQSYSKLRDLCVSETAAQFWEQDARYFSHLENTKWLSTIATCLNIAKQLASFVYQQQMIVILQEQEGRDFNCLISSLMQIILDPQYRTIAGFQGLIQKEWVAMGHPFCNRLRHIRGVDNEECPLFLVFLDCVWQMLQQFPSEFQFTEMYLTTLWDCSHLTVFDTFLFNCSRDKWLAERDRKFALHSLWDWNQMFSREAISQFQNPLYAINKATSTIELGRRRTSSLRGHYSSRNSSNEDLFSTLDKQPQLSKREESKANRKMMCKVLPVNPRLMALDLWRHCYLRWNPLTQIFGGGSPVAHMERCQLVKDIVYLHGKLCNLSAETKSPIANIEPIAFSLLFGASHPKSEITSSFPYSPGGIPSMYGVPINFTRQSTYIASDDESDDGPLIDN